MIDSLAFERLRRIGLTPALLQQATGQWLAEDDATLLRVVELHRDSLLLHDGENVLDARELPALRHGLAGEADALAVGDWVLARCNVHGQWWVHARVPPLNQLARRLHDGRDKVERVVIVSNVDTALLVMGLDLDFNLRRLERYAALVRMAGVEAVVALTKLDLCTQADARLQQVAALLGPEVPVVAVNALTDEPSRALGPWLRPGRTLVLLGSSGAGKSTLTNALAGDAVAATGGTRRGDGRGRHTTTTRTLHGLPQGACIIDTPGLRTWRLDGDAASLEAAFDDVARLAPLCRFRDCRHEAEPGCAVRGGVAPERLRNYHKLQREARRDTLSALERKAQVSEWKARTRSARAWSGAKRS